MLNVRLAGQCEAPPFESSNAELQTILADRFLREALEIVDQRL